MFTPVEVRARRYAALGDPVRLAIVDSLASSDRSPVELRRLIGIESNLLAHHLDVLELAEIISRRRSSGDARRRYVHLDRTALNALGLQPLTKPTEALFVCTRNSARSQLAAALWRSLTSTRAESAGTHPADRIDTRAVKAAHRARLPLVDAAPRSITDVTSLPPLVITVCDQAHEELDPPDDWLHWSVPDPVPVGTSAAFDATIEELRLRVQALVSDPSGR